MKITVSIWLIVIACLGCANPVASQTYYDISSWLGDETMSAGGSSWGCGVSFYDFNNDGLDDLTFGTPDIGIRMFESTGSSLVELPTIPYPFETKQVLWGDYDNDGDADLFVGTTLLPSRMFRNDGDLGFTDVSESCGIPQLDGALNVGASYADYDKDGDLDLYIANFNFYPQDLQVTNHLMRNNGDGTFTDVSNVAGVGNGIQQTFGGVWVDYNRDTWPDLYVFNDRDISPNALYRNNGDGTFTDVGEDTNSNLSIDDMSCTPGDFDNDGWEDLYLTNTFFDGNVMLKNSEGNTFIDITSITETAANEVCWGAQWLDYDNNMLLDLYVAVRNWSGVPGYNRFYVNNGDLTFTDESGGLIFPNDIKLGWTNATGDLNDDGYVDVVQYSDTGVGMGLWLNSGGPNNFIKITLEGVVSNRDGIGCYLECHAGGITQTKYTYCGEDLMSQESQHKIFGLAENTVVDSLIISWPSGIVDSYYDLLVNQSYDFTEGGSLTVSLSNDSNIFLCEGESISLSPGEFDSYLWHDGSDEMDYVAQEDEAVWVTVTLGDLSYTSDTVNVFSVSLEPPLATVVPPACFGDSTGSITLEIDTAFTQVSWQGSINDPLLDNLEAGYFSYVLTDILSGCQLTDSIQVNQPEPLMGIVSSTNVLCFGESTGSISVDITGGTEPYEIDWQGIDPEASPAGEYSFDALDANGCPLTIETTVHQPEELVVAISYDWEGDDQVLGSNVEGGVEPYSYEWSDGSSEDSIVNPEDDSYSLTITDANDCDVSSETLVVTNLNELQGPTITLYPNPADQYITLEGMTEGTFVLIYSPSGQLVYVNQISASKVDINVGDLPSGAYVLQLTNLEGQVYFTKSFARQ